MKIKPFDDYKDMGSQLVCLTQYVMPKLSPSAWKLLTFIVMKTSGFNKLSDRIAISQMLDGCGMGSRSTANNAVNELLEKHGLIEVERAAKDPRGNLYSLNLEYEIELASTEMILVSQPEASTESVQEENQAAEASTEMIPVDQSTSTENDTGGDLLVQKVYTHRDNDFKRSTTTGACEKAASQIDEEFGDCIREIETLNILLNAKLRDLVLDTYLEISPPENETHLQWFKYASAETAAGAERPTWNYFRRILENVNAAGSLQQHIANYENQKQSNGYQNGNGPTSAVNLEARRQAEKDEELIGKGYVYGPAA